jgi:hypothetical protein
MRDMNEKLNNRLRDSTWDSLGHSTWASLGNSLRDSLWHNLNYSLWSLDNSLGDSLRETAQSTQSVKRSNNA